MARTAAPGYPGRMTMIPILKCSRVHASIDFYTRVLDFTCVGVWPEHEDPAYAVLMRGADEVHLSSHAGDGVSGQALGVVIEDAEALFADFRGRGLDPSATPDSPVHQGPTEQSWGTIEFYVDDPDGNTLRFMEREPVSDSELPFDADELDEI